MQVSVLCGPRNLCQVRNPALVVAHPGHELKIFGWLSECKPRVHVLTDGSGGGVARLHSTATLLNRLGVVPGEIFGRVSDAEVYRAILDKRIATFLEIVDGLATSLIENETDFVAGDATEVSIPPMIFAAHCSTPPSPSRNALPAGSLKIISFV